MLIKVILGACMLLVAYQDFRYRAVYWLLFPAIAALVLADSYAALPLEDFLFRCLANMAFLGVQFLLLYAWLFFRTGRRADVTGRYLGWGDILFILCLALYLPPPVFIGFYLVSLALVLVLSLIPGRRGKQVTVPLAGWQALFFLVLLAATTLIGRELNSLSDYLLLALTT